MREGSAVYAGFLDVSKALDLVSHKILFSRLLDRNFPVLAHPPSYIMVQEPAHVHQVGQFLCLQWCFLKGFEQA